MTTQHIEVEYHSAIATIVLNAPPYNALGVGMMDALEKVLAEVAQNNDVRAVIIRGAGNEHFSVGMNLKELPQGIQAKGSIDALLDQRLQVLATIEQMPKPVIAVLNGYCLGGGLELALACHFRVAAQEGARIGLPELELGTVPAWGGSARLTRCVGRNAALEMILFAQKISGPEAHRIGLVHRVWPQQELFEHAQKMADRLAEQPALAVQGMLRCILDAENKSLADSIAQERDVVLETLGTKDQQEGMLAFLTIRKPKFNQ